MDQVVQYHRLGWTPQLTQPIACRLDPLRNYFAAQHAAVHELAELLVVQMSIPRRVELEPFERRTTKYLQDSLGGFCGHIHCASWKVKNPKIDPGPAPLIELSDRFKS